MKIKFIVYWLLSIIFVATNCNQIKQEKTASKNDNDSSSFQESFSFNKDIKETEINGNINNALNICEYYGINGKMPIDFEVDTNVITDASYITKKPYSLLGKMLTIKGKIVKIEQISKNITNGNLQWNSILVRVKDINNPLEFTTIDYWCATNIDSINNKDIVKISGFFTGTYTSTNAFGGSIEALHLVGATVKRLKKYGTESYYN